MHITELIGEREGCKQEEDGKLIDHDIASEVDGLLEYEVVGDDSDEP